MISILEITEAFENNIQEIEGIREYIWGKQITDLDK